MRWRWAMVAGLALVGGLVGLWIWQSGAWDSSEPIVVGILHSTTGPMAGSEQAVVDATVLALEQLNEHGGLLGRPLRWVIADGQSDEEIFAQEAERLIVQEKVRVIFGCWTSASRKAVRPLVERYNHLLIYPVQYEGCEASPNIFYLGAAPNQQIIPAVAWSLENLGRRIALVGSDYIFPRVANEIIKEQVQALEGEIVGESYLPLGSLEVHSVVAEVLEARPDVVLNTINGDTNRAFFQALDWATRDRARIPTVSFSIAENELEALGNLGAMEGHYAAWNYFQSIDRPENAAFVAAFQARYGADRVVSDPLEAAYCGVRLWARAVHETGTSDVTEVRSALGYQSLNAPEGVITIDPESQHAWKIVRIGRVRPDGQFEIVWSSRRAIRPVPFPITRSRSDWEELLNRYYEGWGGRWSSPGPQTQPSGS